MKRFNTNDGCLLRGGSWYTTDDYFFFVITAPKDVDEADRHQALEKLTTREKELLGLN